MKNAISSKEAITSVPILPTQKLDVVQFVIKCRKCGKEHKLYGKFTPSPKIDIDMKRKGLKSLPENGKLVCDCGFEIDLIAPINQVEHQAGKKIIR